MTEDSGYESDTGPRDNPTCAHFLTNTPVTKTIQVHPGFHVRHLNRKGRAISRIVYSHGWSAARIAAIFGISPAPVGRAIANSYQPGDNIARDYEKVDADFKNHFPPPMPQARPQVQPTVIVIDSDDEPDSKDGILPSGAAGERQLSNPTREGPVRTAKTQFFARMRDAEEHDELELPPANPRTSSNSKMGTGFVTVTPPNFSPNNRRGAPWKAMPKPIPIPNNPPSLLNATQGPSDPILPPLGSDYGRPLTSYLHQENNPLVARKRPHDEDASQAAGISSPYEASSSWTSFTVKKPRYALPLDSTADSSAHAGISSQNSTSHRIDEPPPTQTSPATGFQLSTVTNPPASAKPLPTRAPPNLSSTSSTSHASPSPAEQDFPAPMHAELDAFLANAMGVDLRAHRALLLAQGLDMSMLRVMVGWAPDARLAAVGGLLQDGARGVAQDGRAGLSPAHVWALALAIGSLG
ncbi:hypothetical protein B0H13DRAFT_2541156 [Mycena leptocephala]|nr:hypothetical protein B0H13DRAFT_2541156 [Mycena leptocephala]